MELRRISPLRLPGIPRFRSALALAGALTVLSVALGLLATPCRANASPNADAESWRGRYCTPTSCKGVDTGGWNGAAFGAAAVAAVWIARRRDPRAKPGAVRETD